jgi:exonuclease VII small subunit
MMAIQARPNLRLVDPIPLCTTCGTRPAAIDGVCEPCRTIAIAQDYAAQSYQDIQTLIDALERAALALEDAAGRLQSKSLSKQLASDAAEARKVVIKMWEYYGLG